MVERIQKENFDYDVVVATQHDGSRQEESAVYSDPRA